MTFLTSDIPWLNFDLSMPVQTGILCWCLSVGKCLVCASICILFLLYPSGSRRPKYRISYVDRKRLDLWGHSRGRDVNPVDTDHLLNRSLPSYFPKTFSRFLCNNDAGHLIGHAIPRQFFLYRVCCRVDIAPGNTNWRFCTIPSSIWLSYFRSWY